MAKRRKHRDMREDAGGLSPAACAPEALAVPSGRQDIFALLSLALLGLAFLYFWVRAALLSVTHDEAITYFVAVMHSFPKVMTYAHPLMPNNHFLNTYLVKICLGLLPNPDFAMRFPTLLGAALYLTAVYRITRLFLRGPRLVFGVALLALHPFMVDFFSCSRGYGLGLGFFLMGMYFLLCRLREAGSARDLKNTFWAASLSALAVFAHLIFVNIYAAVLCVLAAVEVRDIFFSGRGPGSVAGGLAVFFKRVAASIVPSIVFLLVVLLGPALKIVDDSEIKLLESGGFWRTTVSSLIESMAYGKSTFPQNVVFVVVIGVLAAAGLFGVAAAVRWTRKKPVDFPDQSLLCLGTLLVVATVALFVQHVALKLTYPTGRWAIYYYPVFLLLVLVLTEEARRDRRGFIRLSGAAFFYLFSSALLLHYASCLNVTHFYFWKYDASTRKMLDAVWEQEKNNPPPDHSMRVECEWLFDPAVSYYILTKKLWWLAPTGDPKQPPPPADYYYYTDGQENLLFQKNLELIKKFELSGTWLGRPKTRRRRLPAAEGQAGGPLSGESLKEHDKKMAEDFLDRFTVTNGLIGYLRRGIGWASREKWEAAANDLSKAIKIDPESHLAYLNRGMVYANTGSLDKALADLNEALRIAPRMAEAYDARGNILYQRKDYAAAQRDLDRAIELEPKLATAYHHRGLVRVAMGELEGALEDFGQTMALDPSQAAAASDRGLILLRLGRTEEAVADLTQAIELEPKNAATYRYRARAYEALGDTERARQDLEKAKALSAP